jgi:hypothetical protein
VDANTCVSRRNFGLRALGNVRWSQERWDEAFNIHKRAFEGQIQTFGDNHFETGVLCHRMGCHYERLMDSETSMYELLGNIKFWC